MRPFCDIGFPPEPIAGIETLKTPDLLSFASIEPVTVRVAPLELQIAEKLHAYTRTYENKRPGTRTKDLVNLSLIAELFTLDAARLKAAIDTTFATRTTDQTAIVPTYRLRRRSGAPRSASSPSHRRRR